MGRRTKIVARARSPGHRTILLPSRGQRILLGTAIYLLATFALAALDDSLSLDSASISVRNANSTRNSTDALNPSPSPADPTANTSAPLTARPSLSRMPSEAPSGPLSAHPSLTPSHPPTLDPTTTNPPTQNPSEPPSRFPTVSPAPSNRPSISPRPSLSPMPTVTASERPTASFQPSDVPSGVPTTTQRPSPQPSALPSQMPSIAYSYTLNQSFIEMVLDGVDRNWSNRDITNFQSLASSHLTQFWNDFPNSPLVIGTTTTRVIPGQINRVSDDPNDPPLFDVPPLQLGYNQTILYDWRSPFAVTPLDSRLFVMPFEAQPRPFVEALRNITNNTLPIRIRSIQISIPPTLPPTPGPLVIGQNDRNIIIITVVITMLSLSMAGGYIIYLSRKEEAGDDFSLGSESYTEEEVYRYPTAAGGVRPVPSPAMTPAVAAPSPTLLALTPNPTRDDGSLPPPMLRIDDPTTTTTTTVAAPTPAGAVPAAAAWPELEPAASRSSSLDRTGSAMGNSTVGTAATTAPGSTTGPSWDGSTSAVGTVGAGGGPPEDGTGALSTVSASSSQPPQPPSRYPTYSSWPLSVISDEAGIGPGADSSGGGSGGGGHSGSGEGAAAAQPRQQQQQHASDSSSDRPIAASAAAAAPFVGGGEPVPPHPRGDDAGVDALSPFFGMTGFQLEIQDLDDYVGDGEEDDDGYDSSLLE